MRVALPWLEAATALLPEGAPKGSGPEPPPDFGAVLLESEVAAGPGDEKDHATGEAEAAWACAAMIGCARAAVAVAAACAPAAEVQPRLEPTDDLARAQLGSPAPSGETRALAGTGQAKAARPTSDDKTPPLGTVLDGPSRADDLRDGSLRHDAETMERAAAAELAEANRAGGDATPAETDAHIARGDSPPPSAPVPRGEDRGATPSAPAPPREMFAPGPPPLEPPPRASPTAAPPAAAGRAIPTTGADDPPARGAFTPTRVRVVIGDGAERVDLLISAHHHRVRIAACAAPDDVAAALREGAHDLRVALGRHGLELADLSTGGRQEQTRDSGSGGPRDENPEDEPAPRDPRRQRAPGVRAVV